MEAIQKSEDRVRILGGILVLAIGTASCLRIPGQDILQKILWAVLAVAGIWYMARSLKRMSASRWPRLSSVRLALLLLGFWVPFLLVAVYSVVYGLITSDPLETYKQSITTSGYVLIDICMALLIIELYRAKAFKLLAVALIVSYAITCGVVLSDVGIQNIITILTDDANNLLESHDVGVAVVPVLLTYGYIQFVTKEKGALGKPDYIIVFLLILVLFACGKRSAYLSLVAGAAAMLFIRIIKKSSAAKVICVFCFIACVAYVAVIRLGFLDQFKGALGSVSDRYYVWKYFDNQYEFSPLYLGKGLGYVHRYMESGLGTSLVSNYDYLHNSILQIYIEAGFFGFLIWMTIYLFLIPQLAGRIMGISAENYITCIIVSMIAMFAVDNTLTYPVYQVCLFASIGSYITLSTGTRRQENETGSEGRELERLN